MSSGTRLRRAAANPLNCEPQNQGSPSSPRRRLGPRCGCGGCPPRPETPSSHSVPDRTGKGGGGGPEPSAIFPSSPKHTDTLPGRRLRGKASPASGAPSPRPPRTPARRAWGPEGGWRGSPRPGPRPRGRHRAHAHPPRPPPLSEVQLLAPEKRVVPVRLATHRTTQASSLQNQGTRRRQQGSVLGQGRPGVHPRPRGDGRQSVSRGCGGREHQGLHRGAGICCLPRPPRSSGGRPPSLQPAAALFPLSPLRLGLSLSSDGLRALRFSCVTSSCSSSRSGSFTFHSSPPLSPLRAWSVSRGLFLAPGADRSTGR